MVLHEVLDLEQISFIVIKYLEKYPQHNNDIHSCHKYSHVTVMKFDKAKVHILDNYYKHNKSY